MPPGHEESFDSARRSPPASEAAGTDGPLLEIRANLETFLLTDGETSRSSNQPRARLAPSGGETVDRSESSLDGLEHRRDGLSITIGSGTSNSACSSDSEQHSARSAPTRRRSILKDCSIGSGGTKRVGRSRSIQWSKNLSESNEGRTSRYDLQPADEPAALAFGATRPSLMSGWRQKVLAHGSPGDRGKHGTLGRSVSVGGDHNTDDNLISGGGLAPAHASFPLERRVMFTHGGGDIRKPAAAGREFGVNCAGGANGAVDSNAAGWDRKDGAAPAEGSPSPTPGANHSRLRPPERLHLLRRAPVDVPGSPEGVAAAGAPPAPGLKPPSRLQMLLQTRPNGDHALSLPRAEAPAGADEPLAYGSASFQPSLRARRAAQLSGSASSTPGLQYARTSSAQAQPALGGDAAEAFALLPDAPAVEPAAFARLRPPPRLHLLSQVVPQPPPLEPTFSPQQHPAGADAPVAPSPAPLIPGAPAGVQLVPQLPDPLLDLPQALAAANDASLAPSPLEPALEPILEQAPLVLNEAALPLPPALQPLHDGPACVTDPSGGPSSSLDTRGTQLAPALTPANSEARTALTPSGASGALGPSLSHSCPAGKVAAGGGGGGGGAPQSCIPHQQEGLRPPARLHLLARAVPQIDAAAAPPAPRELARLQRPARLHLLSLVVPQADESLVRTSLGWTPAV